MILNTRLEKRALKRKHPRELHCGSAKALGSAQAPKTAVTNTAILTHILVKNCEPSFRV